MLAVEEEYSDLEPVTDAEGQNVDAAGVGELEGETQPDAALSERRRRRARPVATPARPATAAKVRKMNQGVDIATTIKEACTSAVGAAMQNEMTAFDTKIKTLVEAQDKKFMDALNRSDKKHTDAIDAVKEDMRRLQEDVRSLRSGGSEFGGPSEHSRGSAAKHVPKTIFVKGFILDYDTMQGALTHAQVLEWLKLINLDSEIWSDVDVEKTKRAYGKVMFTRIDIKLKDNVTRARAYEVKDALVAACRDASFNINGKSPTFHVQQTPERQALLNRGGRAMGHLQKKGISREICCRNGARPSRSFTAPQKRRGQKASQNGVTAKVGKSNTRRSRD